MARDIALAGGARQAVLAEAARRLAAAIKPGNDLAVHVDHLAVGVDAQARARVVNHRRRPGGIEGRLGDLVAAAWACRNRHPCRSRRTNCSAPRSRSRLSGGIGMR